MKGTLKQVKIYKKIYKVIFWDIQSHNVRYIVTLWDTWSHNVRYIVTLWDILIHNVKYEVICRFHHPAGENCKPYYPLFRKTHDLRNHSCLWDKCCRMTCTLTMDMFESLIISLTLSMSGSNNDRWPGKHH